MTGRSGAQEVARAKDVARAERLREVAPLVRRFCVARLGPVDGQDAAQEVLEAVWRAQQRPDFADGPLSGYAAATARYQVIHGYADRDRADLPAGHLADVVWADPAPGPAEQVERAEAAAEAARKVRELLAVLSPRERQVMAASGLGTRAGAETATELGMSPSGVRSAQVRAMARMREAVGAASPNPLAVGVPENQRARDAAAVRAAERGAVRGPGGVSLPRELHDAGRVAAAGGRSARELAAEFGVSESTATRWRAATRTYAPVPARLDDAAGLDEVGTDSMEQARHKVAALPAPERARELLDEREQLHRPSLPIGLGMTASPDHSEDHADEQATADSGGEHTRGARSGADVDGWSAA
ncbi:MAG: sigma-70 family RNA polymerase sigma factor [Pseudonocardia sp.]